MLSYFFYHSLMIAITNDAGDTLQLSAGQNLVTERAVAWLSDDELPGEFSYPIDVPLSEANKRFVSHGYRPDLALPFQEMPVTVRMEGVLYRRCTFSFRLNAGKLSGFLKIDSAEFYDKIRNLSLLDAFPDLLFLGDGLGASQPITLPDRLRQIAELPPGAFPCTFFPIRNEGFWESDFTDEKLPGFVRGTQLSLDQLSRITYVNAWELLPSGQAGFPIDLPNVPRYGRVLCPQFYLSYVLERIMTLAGYRIESEWLASEEVQRITIVNLTAMNQYVSDLGQLFSGHALPVGMFLPDTTVSEFLKAIKGRFGLVFTYDGNARVCRITQFIRTVAEGADIDLTPYQSGHYSTEFREGTGYSVRDYVDAGDELYKDADGRTLEAPAFIVGKGGTSLTLRAGTCQLIRTPSGLSEGAQWFVPTLRQPGNTLDPAYKQSSRYLSKEGKRPNAIGIKFLSYRGMTTDSKNNPYPLATPDIYDGQQAIAGQQALKMEGRAGSWRNFLRAYFYFRDQTQKISQPLLLPADVFSGLKLHRLIWLSLEDQIRRSYLIQKIQSDMPGPDGLVPVKLDALTLPSGIEQPQETDEPLVWVEFIFGPVTTSSQPVRQLVVLTVKTWVDAQKSSPALVTGLRVNLRFQRSHYDTHPDAAGNEQLLDYLEYVEAYPVNGAVTVLETAFVGSYQDPQDIHYKYYTHNINLDPGEGYQILGDRVML